MPPRGGWQYHTSRCACGRAAIYQGHGGPLCAACFALEQTLDERVAADIEAEKAATQTGQRPEDAHLEAAYEARFEVDDNLAS